MDLIAIAHPKFRPWFIDEARKLLLIYKDQAFVIRAEWGVSGGSRNIQDHQERAASSPQAS